MSKHQELRNLEKAERKAWNAKMHCKVEADISTVYGQEGKLELEWRKAADACYNYRKAHDLIGLNWKQIEAR